MAITEVLKSKDVSEYMAIVEEFQNLAPNESLAQINTTWAEQTTKHNKMETDRLEHELKTYKNNLIKESIRVS
jgi:COP9 signalosome complex subunit 1